MTRMEKLEREVQKLNRDELAAFRDWFRKCDSDEWNRQIEEDARVARFNALAGETIVAHKAGGRIEL